ncbi:hypothetical protein ACFLZV_00330 [Candidatus Margulisiibacteriota bacterium]
MTLSVGKVFGGIFKRKGGGPFDNCVKKLANSNIPDLSGNQKKNIEKALQKYKGGSTKGYSSKTDRELEGLTMLKNEVAKAKFNSPMLQKFTEKYLDKRMDDFTQRLSKRFLEVNPPRTAPSYQDVEVSQGTRLGIYCMQQLDSQFSSIGQIGNSERQEIENQLTIFFMESEHPFSSISNFVTTMSECLPMLSNEKLRPQVRSCFGKF